MKKLFFTVLAVFAFVFVNAQEEENVGFSNGDFYVSGAIGFGSQSTGDVKSNTFEFSPSAAYFVSDNIAVGLNLGITTRTEELPFVDDIDTNTFNIGAFGRYYATPSNKFSLFGQLGFDYVSGKQEQGSTEAKFDGFSFGVAPGLSYFVSKSFAIEASVGVLNYTTVEPDAPNAESTDTFTFGVDLADINFGIIYKF